MMSGRRQQRPVATPTSGRDNNGCNIHRATTVEVAKFHFTFCTAAKDLKPWPPPNHHELAPKPSSCFKKYVVPNYRRYPVCLVRGEGSYVWDAEGNRYLDFFPGWGCNLLGHCPGRSSRRCRSKSPR